MDPDQSDQGSHCLPVCKNRFEKFARIFSIRHKQTTFSDAGFLGVLRVSVYISFVLFFTQEKTQAYAAKLRDRAIPYLEERWGTKRLAIPQSMVAPYMQMVKLPYLKPFSDNSVSYTFD